MKLIKLGKSNKFAIVDDKDFEYLNQFKWHFHSGYAARNKWENKKFTTIRLHRLLINCPKGKEIDHINKNKLDNRKSNLRICTRSENIANRTKNKNNTTGFKGVTYLKANKTFMAQISINGKKIYLGYFVNPLLAHKVYIKKSKELYGNFASA